MAQFLNYYLFLIAAIVGFVITSGPDCVYTKCVWKFGSYGGHGPCGSIKKGSLIRNVECSDGNTIHICCKLPYPKDILQNRQGIFRCVTKASKWVSPGCIKALLCAQACRNGLEGKIRNSYPEVLPSSNPKDKEFIEAYGVGEAHSCYKKPEDTPTYDDNSCEKDCHIQYHECDEDMAKSPSQQAYMSKAYHYSTRLLHKMRMSAFWAGWMLMNSHKKSGEKAIDVKTATKKAFSKLSERMEKLSYAFKEWQDCQIFDCQSYDGHQRKKRAISSIGDDKESKWKDFLTDYNATDYEMVESIYSVFTYEEFEKNMNVLKEVLDTNGFVDGKWSDACVVTINKSAFAFFVCAMIYFYFN